MKVWIFQTGEPLHIDEGSPRPMRAMNLANSLLDAGHEVVLWSSAFYHQKKCHRCKYYTIFQLDEKFEIRLIPSPGYKNNVSLGRLIDHGQLALNLKKILALEIDRPDIVFIGYPPIEVAAVMASWCKVQGIPSLLDVKDMWPSMFLDVIPKSFHPIVRIFFSPYFYLSKASMKNVTGLSAMTDSFLGWALRYSGRERGPLDGVFPLTSPSSQLTESDLSLARTWWNSIGVKKDDGVLRLFFVGSFMSIYDFKPIAAAAKEVKKRSLSVQFVLCGSGGSYAEVKLMMEGLDNVIFPGWIDRLRIETLAECAHAALAPYLNIENFKSNTTNKIIDAMALGLPILTPLEGEVANLISQYQVGLRYGGDAERTLFDCIDEIRTNEGFRVEMSENGKALYKEIFSFDKVYRNLVSHLELMAGVEHDE